MPSVCNTKLIIRLNFDFAVVQKRTFTPFSRSHSRRITTAVTAADGGGGTVAKPARMHSLYI